MLIATTPDQLGEVGELALQATADLLAELQHAGIGDRVEGVRPLLAAADDARLVEDAEVLRDVLLRRAEALGQLGDGRLAVAQAVEDPDSHRLADDAEAPRDELDDGVGEGVGQGHGISAGGGKRQR